MAYSVKVEYFLILNESGHVGLSKFSTQNINETVPNFFVQIKVRHDPITGGLHVTKLLYGEMANKNNQ